MLLLEEIQGSGSGRPSPPSPPATDLKLLSFKIYAWEVRFPWSGLEATEMVRFLWEFFFRVLFSFYFFYFFYFFLL